MYYHDERLQYPARDTMHQQQWLAVLEELGGASANLPIPNSFPQEMEDQQNNYNFYATAVDGTYPKGRWTAGTTIDGRGEFTVFRNEPVGDEPILGPARPTAAPRTGRSADPSVGRLDRVARHSFINSKEDCA